MTDPVPPRPITICLGHRTVEKLVSEKFPIVNFIQPKCVSQIIINNIIKQEHLQAVQ